VVSLKSIKELPYMQTFQYRKDTNECNEKHGKEFYT
jgi:hypothetical protein